MSDIDRLIQQDAIRKGSIITNFGFLEFLIRSFVIVANSNNKTVGKEYLRGEFKKTIMFGDLIILFKNSLKLNKRLQESYNKPEENFWDKLNILKKVRHNAAHSALFVAELKNDEEKIIWFFNGTAYRPEEEEIEFNKIYDEVYRKLVNLPGLEQINWLRNR